MTKLSQYERFTPSDGCLRGRYCPRQAVFIVEEEHRYDGPHVSVVIAPETPTDFASVPWPFTLFFPKVGPYAFPALLHDELYVKQTIDRRTADSLFLHWMEACHTPKWQRYPMYLAVRAFGWIPWNRRAEKLK